MADILDVRSLEPKMRHSTIMETFAKLSPGSSFVLVNDHEPRPLLYQFQNEMDGEFEWWPLEKGPEVWRVEIEKRREKAQGRTVTDFLQTDHRRLDGIYERFLASYKQMNWDGAKKEFGEFDTGLRRHIKVEEEILFPLFEEKTGMRDGGPTFVMRMEHKEIHSSLDSIASAIAAKDSKAVSDASYLLTNVLVDHNMKEEHILYPESDSFLSEAEKDSVVKKAQTY